MHLLTAGQILTSFALERGWKMFSFVIKFVRFKVYTLIKPFIDNKKIQIWGILKGIVVTWVS
jgi:hypothetical protein